jgi:hypothetical protein
MSYADLSADEILQWAKTDEEKARPSRAKRISKLLSLMPLPEEGFGLHDGETSPYLFNEIRVAYSYGLYLSVVLISLAFLEKQIAATLYGMGVNTAAKLPLDKLLARAARERVIDQKIVQGIDRLRALRNACAHFREPGHEEGIARRSIATETGPEGVLESDADEALHIVSFFISNRYF